QAPDRLAEINQFVNFDYRRSWMLQLMASYRIGNWWNGRVFAFGLLSRDKLDNFHHIAFNRKKLSAVLTTNNTFRLSKKPNWVATLSGRYQTAAIQGIYDIRPMGSADVSLQWTSANGKAKLIVTGEDLFRTSSPHTLIDWEGQRMEQRLDWNNRNVSITLLYKFGGYKERKREAVDTSRIGR
ncbi:MAG: outer membrane beta-barrel protein, partial [Bacteroidaceae bacterium]|nr:outer membrane beta-barrel protein [Bacteroidaceae bacterium]